jgi:protein-tyrosine-phosphatase
MIFFICHGNVARSQFAEALLRQEGINKLINKQADIEVTSEIILADEGSS